MRSYLAVLLFFLFSNLSFAKSNIVGVWIDEGHTLAIQILDNPSQGPFTVAVNKRV